MKHCLYEGVSDEAYRLDPATGTETAIALHLCEWPTRQRLADAPTWLMKMAGGGIAITPERDCVGCPAFVRIVARKDAS